MKSIGALLNSLLSTPVDTAGQSKIQNPFTAKDSQSNGSNFGNVLAQVTSQNTGSKQGNAPQSQASGSAASTGGNTPAATLESNTVSAPNAPTGNSAASFASVSETTVAITESVKVQNAGQLAQAEQALVSLASGLLQIIQMISRLQQTEPQQAQAALASLSSMNLSPSDLQTIISSLQLLVQKLPAEQNPLALTADQQAGLLNQMFQQMVQAQQILVGTAGSNAVNNPNPAGVSALGTSGSSSGQNAILQLNFSNTSLTEIAQNNLQASQVFINLENFKMSATFIQAGSGPASEQGPGQIPNIKVQAGTPVNSQSLIDDLNQTLKNLNNSNPASLPAVPGLPQTVSGNTAVLQSNLNQNFKALVQVLMQSEVTQAALTTFLNNQPKGSQNALSQAQNAVQTVSANNLTQVSAVSSEIQPVTPTALTGAATNISNSGQPAVTAGNNLVANETIPQTVEPVQIGGNSQGVKSGNNKLVLGEVTSQEPPLVQPGITESSTNSSLTGSANALFAPQLTPIQAAGIENSFGLNVKEISTLDAVVARLNVSALHPTQGSLSIGTNTVLPSSALTMGQILGVLEASQLSSGSPVVPNGNPSVPLVTRVPLQQPLLNPNVNSKIISESTQGQLSQPETIAPSTTTGSQTVSILSTISQEPVSQAVQPLVPATQNASLNNLTNNNGVVNSPVVTSNGFLAASTPINPSLVVAGTNGQNSPTPNNPVTINPLPQPVTLPNSGTTPLPNNNNNPAPPPTFTPVALNQTVNTAPTSQAPVVPALASAGEAVKAEIPSQTAGNNLNNAQGAANSSQAASTIKPASPEGVSPVVSVSRVDPTFTVSDVSGKNAPNNSTVLEANALVGATAFSPDKGHGTVAFSLAANTPSSVGPTGSIDSAQILNQISQQVAAQAAEAKTISRLNFQLVPESLGKVTVQIALVDQSVSARIIVTNPDVKEVLQSHMVDLKTALNQAGLQIDQLQVQVQGGGGNLLAQYYQYQQEGSGYRLPASLTPVNESGAQNVENAGDLAPLSVRTSLVNVLA